MPINIFRRRLGLALGGGGARGIAHLGILKHFRSLGIQFNCISGTSSGSIAAALYAFGIPLEKMVEEYRKLTPVEITGLKIGGLGLFRNVSLEEMLLRLLPAEARIEDAPIPLAIIVTDLISGKKITLRTGSVFEAVMASTCVPGFYLPVEQEGMMLVDGGLMENVPVSALKDLGATLKIAVNLNGNSQYVRPEGILDVVSNALDIAIDSRTREQLNEADLVIALDLTDYSRTRADRFDEVVEIARQKTEEVVKETTGLFLRLTVGNFVKNLKDALPFKIPRKFTRWYLAAKHDITK